MELEEQNSADYWGVICKFAKALNEMYDQRIEHIDSGMIFEQFREGNSSIRELVVVARGERFPAVVTTIAWRPFIDGRLSCVVMKDTAGIARGKGLEPRVTLVDSAFDMACHGIIRLVPHLEELESVPDSWRPYLISLEELPAGHGCRIIREGGTCYMSFADEKRGIFRPRRKGKPGDFTL